VVNDAEPEPETASYSNGVLKFSGFRLAGERHGAWRWYRADASLMRTGEFDRGRQVGTWQTFDRTGRLVKETRFPGK
jgi:antitoxin component YwqK of YwqJK toxin-antitoxin module